MNAAGSIDVQINGSDRSFPFLKSRAISEFLVA
jgi:hypothetical protein